MIYKEIFTNGELSERQYFKRGKNAFQIIVLGFLLLAIFGTIATPAIMKHYDSEFPLWFLVADAVAPYAACLFFGIYEMIRP